MSVPARRVICKQPARLLGSLSIAGLLLLAAGCSEPEAPPPPPPEPQVETPAPLSEAQQQTLNRFAQGSANLPEALVSCSQQLQQAGSDFLAKPNEALLDAVKQQWQRCEELYQASTVLVGFTPQQQADLKTARANLGQPLTMPGFIDSVQDYPFSGIVNDASLPLDETSLREQHGVTDESEVSLGLDVVAFLLWGEQRQQAKLPARPVSDYEAASSWDDDTDLPIEEHPNNRRRRLLALTLELLAKDSQGLLDSWGDGALPTTAAAVQEWQQQQLAALNTALTAEPLNGQLVHYIQGWMAAGIVPGIDPATEASGKEASGKDSSAASGKPASPKEISALAARLHQQLVPAEAAAQ